MQGAPIQKNNEPEAGTKEPDARRLFEDMRKALERLDALIRGRTLAAMRAARGK
jgi:hypothetical protein